MGQKKNVRNRTTGTKATSLAPKKLSVRERDAVRGGYSWSATQSNAGVVGRMTPSASVPAVP